MRAGGGEMGWDLGTRLAQVVLVDDEYAGRSKRYRDHRCRQPARNDSVVVDIIINPRRACAARVTVLGSVCLSLPKPVYTLYICSTNDIPYLAGLVDHDVCGDLAKTTAFDIEKLALSRA